MSLFFISFCDNCDYKFTLLSPVEWEELGRIQSRIDAQKKSSAAAAVAAAAAPAKSPDSQVCRLLLLGTTEVALIVY